MPNAANLRRIGENYDVSVDWLLGLDVPELRGATRKKVEIEDDVAIYVEREIALRLKGKRDAGYLAHMAVDGAALLNAAIAQQLTVIKAASRTADLYTRSGAESISAIVQQTASRKKVRSTLLERIAFHAEIFKWVVLERSEILRSHVTLNRKRHYRPLLELARGISPVRLRRQSS